MNTPVVFDSFKLKEPQDKISRKLGGFGSGEWKNAKTRCMSFHLLLFTYFEGIDSVCQSHRGCAHLLSFLTVYAKLSLLGILSFIYFQVINDCVE